MNDNQESLLSFPSQDESDNQNVIQKTEDEESEEEGEEETEDEESEEEREEPSKKQFDMMIKKIEANDEAFKSIPADSFFERKQALLLYGCYLRIEQLVQFERLIGALKNNTHVEKISLSLHLDETEHSKEKYSNLLFDLIADSKFKKIELFRFCINDMQAKSIADALKAKNPLEELDLCNPLSITEKGVQYIANALGAEGSLKSLKLSGSQITNRGIEWINKALNANTSLQFIVLGGCLKQITAEGARGIREILKNNKYLKKFDIGGNGLGDENIEHICKGLACNISLIHLNMSFNQITDKGVKRICESLKNHPCLEYLDLSGNREVTDEGWDYLGKFLENSSLLKSLVLKDCKLNSENKVQFIATIIKNNKSLVFLEISLNFYEEKELGLIAEALKYNTHLEKFELETRYNSEDSKIIQKLLQRNKLIKKYPAFAGYIKAICYSATPRLYEPSLSSTNEPRSLRDLSAHCVMGRLSTKKIQETAIPNDIIIFMGEVRELGLELKGIVGQEAIDKNITFNLS